MPTDYEKIREENILEYGRGIRHLAFLRRLYTDRTHFVYELLQNAEDAKATRIIFRLFDDRLEVSHNGRPFNESDVRGVCGVGEGTKSPDLTQIGEFGIGFKSVYAYTATPEVHSGYESFQIKYYVRPYPVSPKPIGNSWTTLFVFPFNTEKISPKIACETIGERLLNLCARTLLFLRKISEIEYHLPGSGGGVYLREEIIRGPGRQVSVISQNNGKEEKESWLIFERSVSVPDRSEKIPVEVSFRLVAEDRVEKNPGRIIKVKNSPLVVYFPTEKETRFGFLIQGPYRTTPARDNIPKDDKWNEYLVKETSKLIDEILPEIKDLGLLSVSFLEALPIRVEDFSKNSMFYPIFESVRNALTKKDLLPADDGSFVSAGSAKLARGGGLRKLLHQDQLHLLFQSSNIIKWIIGGITQDLTPELRSYLIDQLEVDEVDPEKFARKINNKFLSAQSDEWFIDFYKYLSGQEALWRGPRSEGDLAVGILRSRPILRIEGEKQIVPFKQDSKTPNAFLPPPEETTFPVVKRSIVENERAKDFLKRLGLSEPDVFDDIVNTVLPKYSNDGMTLVSDSEHKADIHKIVRAMGTDSESGKRKILQAAKQTPFLKAINLSGDTTFKRPSNIYIDTENLRRYFSNSRTVWFLHNAYSSIGININVFSDFGISDLPRKLQTSEGLPRDEREHFTRYEIVENYDLDGLDTFLNFIQEISNFEEQKKFVADLWLFLCKYLSRDPGFFKAKYTWFYARQRSKYFDSMIFDRLTNSKWIPSRNGTLQKPGEVNTDQLLDDFRDAHDLIVILGINEESTQKREQEAAKTLGLDDDELQRARQFLKMPQEEQDRVLENFCKQQINPDLSVRVFPDSDRRIQRLNEDIINAPKRETEIRKRSVTVGLDAVKGEAAEYLRTQYTNSEGEMVCQACRNPLPFKLNGFFYFERVQFLTDLTKLHRQNYLALCPNHSAMFRYTIGHQNLEKKIRQANLSNNDLDISIAGKDTKFYFTKLHLLDLQQIVKAEGNL